MHSAIYTGTVSHQRNAPVDHGFRYRIFMPYLDLDELDEVFSGSSLFSTRRFAPARFLRSDYYGDHEVPLKAAIHERVREDLGPLDLGPVRLLTGLRYWGWCFNPVSFYYVFSADGATLTAIVAEITNTPWNERHAYVLRVPADRRSDTHDFHFDKEFHVSPFMAMTDHYDWRFTDPGERLGVVMRNSDGTAAEHFRATMTLDRRPATPGMLARALLRFPWMTATVFAAIYWNALRLRWKGAVYHQHPMHVGAGTAHAGEREA